MSRQPLRELVTELENAATFSVGDNAIMLSRVAWQRLKNVVNALAEEAEARARVEPAPAAVPGPGVEPTINHSSQLPAIKDMKAAIKWVRRELRHDRGSGKLEDPPASVLRWARDQRPKDLDLLESHLQAIGDYGTIEPAKCSHLKPYRGPAPEYKPLYFP